MWGPSIAGEIIGLRDDTFDHYDYNNEALG